MINLQLKSPNYGDDGYRLQQKHSLYCVAIGYVWSIKTLVDMLNIDH